MLFGRKYSKKWMGIMQMASNYVETKSLVPIIPKDKFDEVATEFLEKYCPEALEKPMPVPIMDIARRKMGLKIVPDFRLSEDFSVYGQICFTSGKVPVYIKESDEYVDITVKRGTILIDPDTLLERNIGCLNNTIAHECVHWFKHRNYHMYCNGAGITIKSSYNYPVQKLDDSKQAEWSDDDWMEWQANGIAPKILMPVQTVELAVRDILNSSAVPSPPRWWIINQLADFYKVSKISVEIRLQELGIDI